MLVGGRGEEKKPRARGQRRKSTAQHSTAHYATGQLWSSSGGRVPPVWWSEAEHPERLHLHLHLQPGWSPVAVPVGQAGRQTDRQEGEQTRKAWRHDDKATNGNGNGNDRCLAQMYILKVCISCR